MNTGTLLHGSLCVIRFALHVYEFSGNNVVFCLTSWFYCLTVPHCTVDALGKGSGTLVFVLGSSPCMQCGGALSFHAGAFLP